MAPTPTCLDCSAPLETPLRTSQTCANCGAINLREDLRLLRTRRPGPRRLELALKSVAAVLIGLWTFEMLTTLDGAKGGYAGTGFAIGAPILVSLILWDTLGLITRRTSVLRMEVFWPALVGAFVVGPLLVGAALIVGIGGFDAARYLGPALLPAAVTVAGVRIHRASRPYSRRVRGRESES